MPANTVQPSLRGMAALAPRPSKRAGFKREQKEWQEQCDLFTFLRAHSRKHPEFAFIHSSLNGEFMPPSQKDRAKRAGLLPGVWDIHLPIPQVVPGEVTYCALFLEMKVGRNSLTKEQVAFRDGITKASGNWHKWVVAYSWIDAARAIVDYLGIRDKAIEDALRVNVKPTAKAPAKAPAPAKAKALPRTQPRAKKAGAK